MYIKYAHLDFLGGKHIFQLKSYQQKKKLLFALNVFLDFSKDNVFGFITKNGAILRHSKFV